MIFLAACNTDVINLWRRISTSMKWLYTHTQDNLCKEQLSSREVCLLTRVSIKPQGMSNKGGRPGSIVSVLLGSGQSKCRRQHSEKQAEDSITSAAGNLHRAVMEDFCPLSVRVMQKGQRIKVDCFGNFLKKITFLHLRRF